MMKMSLPIVICAIIVSAAVIAAVCAGLRIRKMVRLDPCVESAVLFFRGARGIKDKSPAARLWVEISHADGKLICRFVDPEGGEIAAAARRIHMCGDESGANNERITEAVNISEFPDGTRISFDEGYSGYTLTYASKLAFPRLSREYEKALTKALAAEGIPVGIHADAAEENIFR